MNVGILCITTYVPIRRLSVELLADHDQVPRSKYTSGLGLESIAYPDEDEDAISMAMTALKKLEKQFPSLWNNIGFFEVGSESNTDRSKSIRSVMCSLSGVDKLPIGGVDNINACYGGTAAVLHATAWLESSQWTSDRPWALVVATDIAYYDDPKARPTEGAGAVAILLCRNAPVILNCEHITHISEHVYDFWKPDAKHESPYVVSRLSQECYMNAFLNVYEQFLSKGGPSMTDPNVKHVVCHHPYHRLVQKTIEEGTKMERVDVTHFKQLYEQKVKPASALQRSVGNTYTASVWMGLYHTLNSCFLKDGDVILLYSYGSGYIASMLQFTVKNPMEFVKTSDPMPYKTSSVQEFLHIRNERNELWGSLDAQFPETNSERQRYGISLIESGKRYYKWYE